MSLSKEGLHYKLLVLFQEFVISKAETPFSLLKLQKLHPSFYDSLSKYSKQSEEICVMSNLLHCKNHYLMSFFLFYRELIQRLRPYEIRETIFLEEISLKFDQWPQILKELCAWNKVFSQNIENICQSFDKLYEKGNGRFNKGNNSIKSLDLLRICFEIIEPNQKKENSEKKSKKNEDSLILDYFSFDKKKVNYMSKIFASPKTNNNKLKKNNDISFSPKKEKSLEENKISSNKKKLSNNNKDLNESNGEIETKLMKPSNEKLKISQENRITTIEKLSPISKISKNEFIKEENSSLIIKPPKKYYKHLLAGDSTKFYD